MNCPEEIKISKKEILFLTDNLQFPTTRKKEKKKFFSEFEKIIIKMKN